ncbi:2419_t:CDS:2 [Ambispora gerdemannii]|uniref:2419_t:CDS:1 n=1 Tax=Ambispora gerdemannii TaxID=144530 RepID=A0A9N9AGC5_9GLOM|nr:2419_t:CDS:2 [Ambispora gerdemannii]
MEYLCQEFKKEQGKNNPNKSPLPKKNKRRDKDNNPDKEEQDLKNKKKRLADLEPPKKPISNVGNDNKLNPL